MVADPESAPFKAPVRKAANPIAAKSRSEGGGSVMVTSIALLGQVVRRECGRKVISAYMDLT